jgi:hypothetical protein
MPFIVQVLLAKSRGLHACRAESVSAEFTCGWQSRCHSDWRGGCTPTGWITGSPCFQAHPAFKPVDSPLLLATEAAKRGEEGQVWVVSSAAGSTLAAASSKQEPSVQCATRAPKETRKGRGLHSSCLGGTANVSRNVPAEKDEAYLERQSLPSDVKIVPV